jgi:hypothetical protein
MPVDVFVDARKEFGECVELFMNAVEVAVDRVELFPDLGLNRVLKWVPRLVEAPRISREPGVVEQRDRAGMSYYPLRVISSPSSDSLFLSN